MVVTAVRQAGMTQAASPARSGCTGTGDRPALRSLCIVRASCLLVIALACGHPAPLSAGGEIHGTVHVAEGRSYTGSIRWDINEVFWDDVLDAEKSEQVWVEGDLSGVRIFGLSLGDDQGYWTRHPFKVQFGNLAALERRPGGRVQIELKNGDHLEIRTSGTDLGESMRDLVVRDRAGGEFQVSWDDLDRVEFSEGPGEGLDAERLYGKVQTSSGAFTGFVTWDRDEALVTDTLDGDLDGEARHIAFADIREIERAGSSASRVTLADGTELKLTGTNDVDDDNRGIDVYVPDLGVVKVAWEEFDRVVFEKPPASRHYADFSGGTRLHGTLTDEEGKRHTGNVTWDLDEKYTWEFLDGQFEDLEFEIPFALIRSIHRDSRHAAEVRLKSGASYVISGSNDVGTDNKGIILELPEGDEMDFDWQEFESLEFSDP